MFVNVAHGRSISAELYASLLMQLRRASDVSCAAVGGGGSGGTGQISSHETSSSATKLTAAARCQCCKQFLATQYCF